jgi:hypothetical protein
MRLTVPLQLIDLIGEKLPLKATGAYKSIDDLKIVQQVKSDCGFEKRNRFILRL